MFRNCLINGLSIAVVSLTSCLPATADISNVEASASGSQVDQVIQNDFYSVGYSYDAKHALYVQYRLFPELVRLYIDRENDYNENFRADVRIPAPYRAELSDYVGSGLDRGHILAAATADHTLQSLDSTFVLSNISPQLPGFNRGDWRKFEAYERECSYALEDGQALDAFTGPVFSETVDVLGNGVWIPHAYYKVLYDLNAPQGAAMAFIAPQNDFDFNELAKYQVTIDEVEDLTGLDFMSDLDDTIEARIEGAKDAFCPISASLSGGESASFGDCSSKKYCSQMASCEEAKYFLTQCGLARLDADSDGTPCEQLCRQ